MSVIFAELLAMLEETFIITDINEIVDYYVVGDGHFDTV
jgi:hypothetical protein